MTIKVYFDGACHNDISNPSGNPIGYGCVLAHDTDLIATYACTSKQLGTSNTAEWEALWFATQKALDHANSNHYAEYMFLGDSQLIVNQLSGKWQIKEPLFTPYYIACKANIDLLKRRNQYLGITWIPREHNTLADQQSKSGLELYKRIFQEPPTSFVTLPHKFNRENLFKWAQLSGGESRIDQFAALYNLFNYMNDSSRLRYHPYTQDDRKRFDKVLRRDFVEFSVKTQ